MTLLGDADVHNEREKVMARWGREYVVVIRNLSKVRQLKHIRMNMEDLYSCI